MSSLNIQVNITGGTGLIDKLNSLGESFNDFSDAFRTIGQEIDSYAQNQAFNSQGGVYGEKWRPVTAGRLAYKKKNYPQYDTTPLVATGTMRRSFNYRASAKSLIVGNSAPYFVYHQSSAPRTKMPRRQMLGVNNDVKSIIKQVITKDINSKIGAVI